jgi:HEAT repeat protein
VVTVYNQSSMLKIPVKERMEVCKSIIKKEKDESLRGEAVWVLGAIASELNLNDPLRDEIGDLLEFVLIHDNSDVVKHEAVFQIADSNLKKKIYVVVNSALNDPSELVRHEAVEALGLIAAFDQRHVLLKALNDKKDCVRQTAAFVLKQLDRLEKAQHALNENK